MKKFKLIITIALIPMLIIIKNIEIGNLIFEKYYSNLLYLFISEKLRFITGWISIPVGDILYLFIILSLIYFLLKGGIKYQSLNKQI